MAAQMHRRAVLASALAVGTAAATGLRPASAQAALPVVDMELLLLAAQINPVQQGTPIWPGAGESVRLVEQALTDRGLLRARYVDGHFGTASIDAYAQWQKSLGHSGLAANGLPGVASLTTLGSGRFTLSRAVRPGSRVSWRGYPFNTRTVDMLLEAERLCGLTFAVDQGSYSPGTDPTSAGTHDGGGTADLDADALTRAQRTSALVALRSVGFAAWLRTPAQHPAWPYHLHVVAGNDTDLSRPAQQQIGQYYLGRNGLSGHGPDDGPQVEKLTWEQYQRNRG